MSKQKFHIGDQVAVLDDVIKGIVISVEKYVITIKDETDFLLHFKPSELVLIHKESPFHNIDISAGDKDNLIKKPLEKSKKIIKNNKKNILEVDLHIHQITYSNKNMSNYEMLTKQLEIAKQKIEFAIKENIKKIIFIHGVGRGVLKTELYQLFKKYPVEINDASYQKYGSGATEIYIFKNKTN